MMAESGDGDRRIKRLRLRSWRRGMREMDLLLGPYADKALAGLGPAECDAYERLLEETDPELYHWLSGRVPMPAAHAAALLRIAGFHGIVLAGETP